MKRITSSYNLKLKKIRLRSNCHITADKEAKAIYDNTITKKQGRELRRKERESKFINKKKLFDLLKNHKLTSIEYNNYLNTKWWKFKRIQKLKSVQFICEKCGSNKKLNVHHLHYNTLYREKDIDLMVLCDNCHKLEHNIEK
jgi:DNA-directed RNA polymerase subunit M/transcription elongation factor TFIIS